MKIRDSYKSERVTARKSMPIGTNPQPRLRNTSRDGLGGGGDIATRKCIGTFEGRDEGGSKAELRRPYKATTKEGHFSKIRVLYDRPHQSREERRLTTDPPAVVLEVARVAESGRAAQKV